MKKNKCTSMLTGFVGRTYIGLIVLVLAGPLQAAWGQTCDSDGSRYVSPTGSDNNNGQSTTSAWQTVEKAFTDSSVAAGCTVYFMEGVYSTNGSYVTSNCGVGTSDSGDDQYAQVLAISGSAGSPITYTNYPGQVAIIQGDTRIGTSSCPVSYVTFQGTPTLAVGAWGLVFEQCALTTAPCAIQSTPEDVIDVMYSHDVTFNNVEVRYGNYHAGFYQSSGYNIRLLNSYIHDNGCPPSSASCPTNSINNDSGVYWDKTTGGGNVIANCVVENNVAPGIQLYSNTSGQPQNVTVEENTVVNNGNWGIALVGQNNNVVNNILQNNGSGKTPTGANIGNYGMKVDVATQSGGQNLFVIDSNVAVCTLSTSVCHSGIYYSVGPAIDTNTIQQDAKFVNAYAGYILVPPAADHHNYRLQSSSPAFTTQNANYVQSADKDGVSRSGTSALGAYVYYRPKERE